MSAMEEIGHKFEPEAVEYFGIDYALTASIAISLKRIADVLEGGATDRMTIFELIADRMPSQIG